MKQFKILFLLLGVSAFGLKAQVPQKISYQAVVRDADQKLAVDKTVGVKISIMQDSASILYSETHTSTTNAQGILSLEIGGGKIVSGKMETIDWSINPCFVKMEMDLNGGSSYTLSTVQQLLSVPYAMRAAYAEQGGIQGRVKGDMQYWDGEKWTLVGGARNGKILSFRNGEPTWIFPGDTTGIVDEPIYGSVTDHEGTVYKTVLIGNALWMAENLRATTYRDGSVIPRIDTNEAFYADKAGAYCYYGDNDTNKLLYGPLYNWYAMAHEKGLCPKGWHVPSDAEWTTLADYYGGKELAGAALKATGTVEAKTGLWLSPNTGATNSSGFAALPGGMQYYYQSLPSITRMADFWTSTEHPDRPDGYAYIRTLVYNNTYINRTDIDKASGVPIRCIKD